MGTLTVAPEQRSSVNAPNVDPATSNLTIPASHRSHNAYFVIVPLATMLALATAAECGSIQNFGSLVYGTVLWGWWALFACILWRVAPMLPLVSNLSVRSALAHATIGSALGLTHLFCLWIIGFPLGWGAESPEFMWHVLFNVNRFGIELLLYAFIMGITGVLQYQMRAQRETLRAVELEKQLSTAHLRALQSQLEPHFLFNTLNAITTLVELGRQQQAAEMLSHLNSILKSTLKRSAPEKIALAQELEMIDNYLAIEQVRFADRLHVEIKIDPGALDGLVPCFLLQPIVENAIRHGIAPSIHEGAVFASARREGHTLHLHVRDSGAGTAAMEAHEGHGIGLRNTRERLMHFYQDGFQMRAEPLLEGGFEVAISIPYEPLAR